MSITVPRRIRALALALASAALLATAVGADRAAAIVPAQTTTSGLVNLLGGWVPANYNGTVEDFWRRTLPAWGYSYSKPQVRYYGDSVGHYSTPCTHTSYWTGENGFYCSGDNSINLDYWGQQSLMNRLGDFGAGGLLAHEWAHRAQARMGTLIGGFRQEYNADCMAGLYVRFGYNTGRLSGSDYWEFYNWLHEKGLSTTHGYGPNRAAWFAYGYSQYNKAACDAALQLTSSVRAARAAQHPTARSLRPPARLARVDLTPRRSKALPAGAPKIKVPKSQQIDPHTPIH